jgi:hypothetical protein
MNEGTRSGKGTIRLLSAERPTNGLYLYLLPLDFKLRENNLESNIFTDEYITYEQKEASKLWQHILSVARS